MDTVAGPKEREVRDLAKLNSELIVRR
jgi:hypothetical protein